MLRELAERADRAIRTNGVRSTARAVAEAVARAVTSAPRGRVAPDELVRASLHLRPNWTEANRSEFVCAFGQRKATLTIPSSGDALQIARLITRIEVKVLFGTGVDEVLLRELQALAEREVQRTLEESLAGD